MDNKLGFFASMIFSKKVFATLFGKQHFKTPEPIDGTFIPKTHFFEVSDSYFGEWEEMFEKKTGGRVPPYSYYWPWMVDYTVKYLLPELGISLKNVLHLGHEAVVMNDFQRIRQAKNRLKNSLVDLCPLKGGKLVIVTETFILDEKGQKLYSARDFTVVLNMRAEDLKKISRSPLWNYVDLPFRNSSFREKETLLKSCNRVRKNRFYCKKNIAGRFGRLAGALSVTHASELAGRIFRQGRFFLQGMCTANIVIQKLCIMNGEDISHFSIYFTNLLSFPQMIEIRFDERSFEVYDESDTMVAYGFRRSELKGEKSCQRTG